MHQCVMDHSTCDSDRGAASCVTSHNTHLEQCVPTPMSKLDRDQIIPAGHMCINTTTCDHRVKSRAATVRALMPAENSGLPTKIHPTNLETFDDTKVQSTSLLLGRGIFYDTCIGGDFCLHRWHGPEPVAHSWKSLIIDWINNGIKRHLRCVSQCGNTLCS